MSQPSPRYSYCKLYVSSRDRNAVMTLLSNEIGAVASGYFATAGCLSLDVLRNSDADDGPLNDFVFWPTIIEVTNVGGSDDEMIDTLSTLLRSAWAYDLPVVAACPFEEELPWSGGIGRVRG